jgi:hypothetical protein
MILKNFLRLSLACLLVTSCQKQEAARNEIRFATLDAVDRSKIPHVREFLALYPQATVRYLDFAETEFPGLSLDAMLYDRYVLNLRLPVDYSADSRAIVKYGDPQFLLTEISSVTELAGRLHETMYGSLQLHFGAVEWAKVVAAKGDLSVLGQPLEKGKPVKDFALVRKSYDELKR